MIENYAIQRQAINKILLKRLGQFSNIGHLSDYGIEIIKPRIAIFEGYKTYLDTSCVNEFGPIDYSCKIDYLSKPSRAHMTPVTNSVWFAKMRGSKKIIVVIENDKDFLNGTIFSTGFIGIRATERLPISLLYSFAISDQFQKSRDNYSTGTLMEGVTNKTLLQIIVPLLSKEETIEFGSQYDCLIKILSEIRRKEIILKSIKSKLLEKYF